MRDFAIKTPFSFHILACSFNGLKVIFRSSQGSSFSVNVPASDSKLFVVIGSNFVFGDCWSVLLLILNEKAGTCMGLSLILAICFRFNYPLISKVVIGVFG